ncbi:MAG: TetR/AcrR family transcriptional regulator [Actinomycetes bacterium]
MTDAPMTARARVRQTMVAEIKQAARAQVATSGAAGLSLRLVCRDLGMSSSAIYRYFASRDELLTALILDGYDAVGAAAEEADATSGERGPRERFARIAAAVRAWALQHPHEYALLYGSPVPGYSAPPETIGPATRVAVAFARVLVDAHHASHPDVAAIPMQRADLDPGISAVLPAFAALPDDLIADGLMAWTSVFGLISFELFGHLVGSVADPTVFFASQVARIADGLNLE